MVEHSTADREVIGSIPVPSFHRRRCSSAVESIGLMNVLVKKAKGRGFDPLLLQVYLFLTFACEYIYVSEKFLLAAIAQLVRAPV